MRLRMVLEPFLPGYMARPENVAEALEIVRDWCARRAAADRARTAVWGRLERVLTGAAQAARKETT